MDFEIKCAVCGGWLDASWARAGLLSGSPQVDVEPCAPCMNEAKLEAAEEARNES